VSEWQPIETCPKDGSYVLVYDRGWCGGPPRMSVSRWTPHRERNGELTWRIKGGFSGVTSPSFWRQLPAAPQFSGGSQEEPK